MRLVDTLVILLVILVVVVIWRGPKTIPQIGAMLGRGVKAAREEASRIRTDESDPGEPPSR
ncbi:MAG: translocase [Anaerolinea sp.]|nr:translocase [Anaerolinea sp.]